MLLVHGISSSSTAHACSSIAGSIKSDKMPGAIGKPSRCRRQTLMPSCSPTRISTIPGWLPRLVRMGYGGPKFCSRATSEIVPLVLYDAAHLQAEDVANKTKRHKVEGRQSRFPPAVLYDENDVTAACEVLRGLNFAQPEAIAPGVTATLLPSGHILGASIVLLEHQASKKRVLFSGDLGRPSRPLGARPGAASVRGSRCHRVTYGDRIHDDALDLLTQLANVITPTLKRGGSVLVPCFAVERAQELLFYLQKLCDTGRIDSYHLSRQSNGRETLEGFR